MNTNKILPTNKGNTRMILNRTLLFKHSYKISIINKYEVECFE